MSRLSLTTTEDLKCLKLPLVAAPMFLSSGPDLVVACCTAGIVGTFPAHNQRTVEGFEQWIIEIKTRLAQVADDTGIKPAPFGVNLIVHKSNAKLADELAICIKHQVPIIITSLGAVRDVVDQVHGYGGMVWHDIINLRHAHKAVDAGVDGLIAVTAGAGGHTGTANPFALMHEIRSFFDGYVLLSGSLSSGADLAAAQIMGADFGYMGTRFIATNEAASQEDYKNMIVASHQSDIVSTDQVTGVNANFIKASLDHAGIDLAADHDHGQLDINEELGDALRESNSSKPWRDIWSAGHGVGSITDIPIVKDLIDRMITEYRDASDAHFERVKGKSDAR